MSFFGSLIMNSGDKLNEFERGYLEGWSDALEWYKRRLKDEKDIS